MKRKDILSILENMMGTTYAGRHIVLHDRLYLVASEFEKLIDAEVESRIAERMPSDKEGQLASFNRYPQHGSDQIQQYKQAAFFLGWRMCLDELRSRLKNNSQKTEGGE